ncbi:MAG: hypothetical protein ACKOQ6_11650 [Bacteroidota bacterium]
MAKKSETVKKSEALKVALQIGCSGAHKGKDGNWMPCGSHEELMRISDIAETPKWRTVVPDSSKKSVSAKRSAVGKRKKKRRSDDWENLTEAPIIGIEAVPGLGIVSGASFSGKSVGPEYVRENDPDVFMDPESARFRSRQIGCIGISRRVSKNGRTVWMPCTNMTDYANRTGSTALGRRNIEKRRQDEVRNAVRTVFRENRSPKIRRKMSLAKLLHTKFLP